MGSDADRHIWGGLRTVWFSADWSRKQTWLRLCRRASCDMSAGEIEEALITKSQSVAFGEEPAADARTSFADEVSSILARAS